MEVSKWLKKLDIRNRNDRFPELLTTFFLIIGEQDFNKLFKISDLSCLGLGKRELRIVYYMIILFKLFFYLKYYLLCTIRHIEEGMIAIIETKINLKKSFVIMVVKKLRNWLFRNEINKT